MITMRVERPGFLTTVQDMGRPGCAHLGISTSGAADSLALRLGNLLVGNDEREAALEMTLVGGAFGFDAEILVAVTGADFGPMLAGRTMPAWKPVRVARGARLELGPARDGARCYLCVRGGIDVPKVLGSASTHLLTGLGGHCGRALRTGDILPIGPAKHPEPQRALAPDEAWIRALYSPAPIRITPGPQLDWFAPEAMARLEASTYTVLEQSNRMGIRLAGPPLERAVPDELLTEGVSLGAIQVPESGQPILLFVEHQTTGGYPKIANGCSADLHRVGQLRARDTVRFQAVTLDEARDLLLEREAKIDRLRGHAHAGPPAGPETSA